jgi:hypothetical protein
METKKEFHFFTILQHKKEEEYLRAMHRSGWRFVRVSGFGKYHFEKCEPEDVVYQLDYNPQTKERYAEYLQMFADCGWEHIQDYAGYGYFRKKASEMNGEEEIFNDEASKVAMMERVFKGRLLPLCVILCACLLPMFINHISRQNYVAVALLGGIIGVYLGVFAVFGISYYKMKKK